jgi:hypothetical protein
MWTRVRWTAHVTSGPLKRDDAGLRDRLIGFVSLVDVNWRPRPESNRGARICNPLRHHSATWPSYDIYYGWPLDSVDFAVDALEPSLRCDDGLPLQ